MVQFVTHINGNKRIVQLHGVKHLPSFGHNLISLTTLNGKGMQGGWGLGPNSEMVLRGFGRDKIYEVEVLESGPTTVYYLCVCNRPANMLTWHCRPGHVAIHQILCMANRKLVDGLNVTDQEVHGMCEDCLYGKATKQPFDKILRYKSEVLERVHLDLFGPSKMQTRGGASYLMLCTDGKSSFWIPYYLTNKWKETGLKALHKYWVMAEKQTRKVLKTIQINGSRKLNNSLVDAYCKENRIIIKKVPHDSSAANGVVKQSFWTVMEETHTLLENADLPYLFWVRQQTCFSDVIPV